MSSRRSRSSEITGDEINDFVGKIQELIPKTSFGSSARASTSNILKEACKYMKSLHREVDDLSEKLTEMLASLDQ
ncbi:hypothetical protein AQUCO_07400016v1 [Aquilegia coerulea]|uniref:Uncharacterized protein n=1 Tax=Aquilegia coerulea TaxID=218851 RepID=A0A2G5C9F4_AQUCA|nr:hypothetical protein AQUCO_07400016v1 [Aquilegia coerulea]